MTRLGMIETWFFQKFRRKRTRRLEEENRKFMYDFNETQNFLIRMKNAKLEHDSVVSSFEKLFFQEEEEETDV